MALNDELNFIHDKIKYYTSDTYHQIPSKPGVYAWFYPLRLKNSDMHGFIEDINKVNDFIMDNKIDSDGIYHFPVGWNDYKFSKEHQPLNDSKDFIQDWKRLYDYAMKTGNHEEVNNIKKIIFLSSILAKPLYVGKSNNLNKRCQQHINGQESDKNTFHNRFCKYAEKKGLRLNRVDDLIFACIITKNFETEYLSENCESMIERILINLIKPIYSLR